MYFSPLYSCSTILLLLISSKILSSSINSSSRARDLNIRFSDKFNIHTITEDTYTLEDSDFDGNTLVRCTSNNSAVNITIPLPPSENFIGSGITIRKSNGDQNTLLNLLPSDGVTITPLDITPLRRIGSTVVLVYVGNGVYEAFGELP